MITKILLSLLLPQLALSSLTPTVKGVQTNNLPGWSKKNIYAIEPIISANAAVVIDAKSGQILFKKNHKKVRPIASITKLIAAYLYLQSEAEINKIGKLLTSDERNGGIKHIYQGEFATAWDLLNLSLVASDNSAAIALARLGGFLDDFADKAGKITNSLNLENTNFVEPSGLNPENYSNAYEIALLSQQIFKKEQIRQITTQKRYNFSPFGSSKIRKAIATNELLENNFFKITAGKTGFTKEAEYCLTVKAKNRLGKEIIVVILGAPSSEKRFQDAKTLIWWIFKNFK